MQPKSLSERREIEEEDEAIMGFNLFGNGPLEEKEKDKPKPKPKPSSGPTYPQVHPSNLTELFKHQTEVSSFFIIFLFPIFQEITYSCVCCVCVCRMATGSWMMSSWSSSTLAILEAAGTKSLGRCNGILLHLSSYYNQLIKLLSFACQ